MTSSPSASAEMPTHALGSLTVIATAIQEAHGVRADWDKSVKQAEQVLSALEAADLVVRERHE